MNTDCKECGGSRWVNAAGFKTIPTTDADPHRLPCGSCRPMLAPEPEPTTMPTPKSQAMPWRTGEPPTPPTVAYQPEVLALLERTADAAERTATAAEFIADWLRNR